LENLDSYSKAQSWMTSAHTSALTQPYGSVYIPFESAFDENRIFSGALSYKKGAAIIHSLRGQINDDELFFSGMRAYLNKYKDSVATGEDFKNSMEASTGMDFDLFFDQWYYGKGFPSFNIGYSQSEDTLIMKVTQKTSSSSTPLFNMYIEYKLYYQTSDTTVRLFQDISSQTYKIPIKEKVKSILVDPFNKILNGSGVVVSSEELDPLELSFDVYPNPSENNLTVSIGGLENNSEKTIEIFSLNGTLVYKKGIIERENVLDISDFIAGMYTIRISNGEHSVAKRFIKK